ncbi:MAG TPA: hypothetical protein VMW75_03910 [Thermoanaerobaculia bacterium]|nr:hypothetical protein [Thermoanaerobaculia bacterium]
MVAPDDNLHQVQASADKIIAPQSVCPCPEVGCVPQYADTVASPNAGYNPAGDCDGYFMSYKFQPNNNCYAYGCNIASNSFPQPGRMHCYLYPTPPTGPGVQEGALKDGLYNVGTSKADLRAHAATGASGHYVALLVSQADTPNGWPGDYHWARCDDPVDFNSWSQKDGNDQVTNFDFAGNPITDPATANWTVNQGPVNLFNSSKPDDNDDLVVSYDFFTYMFVPATGVSII